MEMCGSREFWNSGDTIPDYRLFHSGLSFLPSHPISRELSIVSPELPELKLSRVSNNVIVLDFALRYREDIFIITTRKILNRY